MTTAHKEDGFADFERILDLSNDDDIFEAIQRDPQAAIDCVKRCHAQLLQWSLRLEKLERASITALAKKRDEGV